MNRYFYSVPSSKLIEVLEEMFEFRAKPKRIRVENGPKFIAGVFKVFCNRHKIELKYIQPRKPAQNRYIERFNRTSREDILGCIYF